MKNGKLTVIPPNETPLVTEAIGLADMNRAQMGEALVCLGKMETRYDNLSGVCAVLKGLVLIHAKARLPHGDFTGFSVEFLGGKSKDTRARYQRLAHAFIEGKVRSTANFGPNIQLDKFGRTQRVTKAFQLVTQDLATSLEELEKFQLDLRHPVVSQVAEWVNGRGSYQLMLDYPAPLGGRRTSKEKKLTLAEVRALAESDALASYGSICKSIDRFLRDNSHTLIPKSQRVLMASLCNKAKRSLDAVAD